MKRIGRWIQSESRKFSLRGNHEMVLERIKKALDDGDILLIYEFINSKVLVNKLVNGDPYDFCEILSLAIKVRRRRFFYENINEILYLMDDIILQLIKAAKKVHLGVFDGRTPLMLALANRLSYEIIDQLLIAGSDVNAPSGFKSPLMYAVDSLIDKRIITELINRGADVNCRNQYGWTPLFYSMCYNYDCPDFIMMLLRAGVKVHHLDFKGENVLMIDNCHCLNGSDCKAKDSIDVLFKYGIGDTDLKHTDNEGNTVLHKTYCKYVFELAIRSGVSIEAKNNKGQTPLLKDLRSYYKEKLCYILKRGANIHSTDPDLQTVIHLCILNINELISPHVLDMLIYHGANMYARNINNQTPLDIIIEKNCFHKELAYSVPKHIILFDDEFDFGKEVLEKLVDRARFSSFIDDCKKELNLLRNTFIARGVTFYQFCVLKRYYKSNCINISLNENKYSCSEISELFPIYKNIIIIRIKDNRLKKYKLDLCRRFEKITLSSVRSVETDWHEVLDYDCLYHISQYLNYKEMFNIFNAAIES